MSTTNIQHDAVEAYHKTTFIPVVLISGYYGFDNLGDDLILHVLVEQLKQRHTRIIVLSNKPEETAQRYGVEAIPRTHFLKIMDAMAQCHLFISGGGGLLQDKTGPNSILYYGGLMLLSELFELPTMCFAQGVGPIENKYTRWLATKALSRCTNLTVRDEKSADLVRELTDKEPTITLDPVWLMEMPQKVVKKDAEKLTIGLSLREWDSLTPAAMERLAKFFKHWVSQHVNQPVEFLLFSFQNDQDETVLEQMSQQLYYANIGTWKKVRSEDIINTMPQCDLFFGMRYHSLVLAILSGIQSYGLIYDSKVESLLKSLNLKGTSIENFGLMDPEEIQDYFNAYPEINIEPLQDKAYNSFEILDGILSHNVRDFLIETD